MRSSRRAATLAVPSAAALLRFAQAQLDSRWAGPVFADAHGEGYVDLSETIIGSED